MKRSIGFLFLMQAIFAGAASAAGIVTVTFSGLLATPAPSTWLLMGLGLVFAFFVFRKAHSLPGGRTMAAILMLIGVSAYEVFTGHSLVKQASAIVTVITESITGGTSITFTIADDGATEGKVMNNTASTLTVTSVTLGAGSSSGDFLGTPDDSPQCVASTVLAPSASCYVKVFND